MLAFSGWEVIAACVFLMFLLPLIFFIASVRRRPRLPQSERKKHMLRAAPSSAAAATVVNERPRNENQDSTE